MNSASPTVVVEETSAGRGAVAVLSVAGPDAVRSVDACFRAANGKPLDLQPPDAIRFGRWNQERGEEVVVCRRLSDGAVEVHCHGGAAAVQAIKVDLARLGCFAVDYQDAPGGPPVARVTADAQDALRHAVTERTAGVLLDQADGALATAVRKASEELSCKDASPTLDRLLRWTSFGLRLTRPWSIVLAGAPNVGKSSLINALLGYGRTIVYDQPGTTRDVVTAGTAIDGWPVAFADTAGLRTSTDELEAEGIRLARLAIANADLVLEVRDASQPELAPAGDEAILVPERILVWSKCDLADPPTGCQGVATSAKDGVGIDALLKAISQAIVPVTPAPGEAVPVTDQHAKKLRDAQRLIATGDTEAAREVLLAMLAPVSG